MGTAFLVAMPVGGAWRSRPWGRVRHGSGASGGEGAGHGSRGALDWFCGLVISHVEPWFQSLVLKTCKHIIESCYNSCVFDVCGGYGKNVVGVILS